MTTTTPALEFKEDAGQIAAEWRARLSQSAASTTPGESRLPASRPDLTFAALAEFVAGAFRDGKTLLIVVPDDEWLPEISNALDLALRPLCLVLPAAGFAAGITLRATLSLLKSRLTRDVDAEWRAAWDAQCARLETHAAIWRTLLDWSTANRGGARWPAEAGELFPVCILPLAQIDAIAGEPRDMLLLVQPESMSFAYAQFHARARQMLILRRAPGARGTAGETSRALALSDDERRLRSELDVLAQELGELELEFATAQAELAEFTRRYHERIGNRIAELDALQAQFAERQAAQMPDNPETRKQAEQARARSEQSQRERSRFRELDREIEKPFAPSSDLKRLFRHLAQKIHPDRAENETERVWRTDLMSEANRAYRSGDAMVLHEILRQWETGQPAAAEERANTSAPHPRHAGQGAAQELERQIAALQKRLAEVGEQLNRLLASRLYELFAATNMAKSRNRDLLKEMAEQLDAQIDAARQRLESVAA